MLLDQLFIIIIIILVIYWSIREYDHYNFVRGYCYMWGGEGLVYFERSMDYILYSFKMVFTI